MADDEPEYLDWVIDYASTIGLETVTATTVARANALLADGWFRGILIDMNMPSGGPIERRISDNIPLVATYPGLAVVQTARNRGYPASRTIVFTVHDDDEIDVVLRSRIDANYILKGRPADVKSAILRLTRLGMRATTTPSGARPAGRKK